MNFIKKGLHKHWYLFIVLILALILELPQIINQNIIIGSDTIFHFNRFYDAMEQIKHFNFQYWASEYGFQNSMRIVSPVYSPWIAYLNGFILLICHNFIWYEIISRILISIIATLSMNYGLKVINIKGNIPKIMSICYAFSFIILRWGYAHNFTSLGAAVMPLCIGIAIRMIQKRPDPINIWQLGLSLALIIQVHLSSALQMMILYSVFAIIGLIRTEQKTDFLKKGLLAAGIAIIFSTNIIGGLFELYRKNHIFGVSEFNLNARGTFNWSDYHNGKFALLIVLIGLIVTILVSFFKVNTTMKIVGITALSTYLLASDLLPWITIFKDIPGISIIQFPSRFIAPAIALSFIYLTYVFNTPEVEKSTRYFLLGTTIIFSGFIIVYNTRLTKQLSNRVLANHAALYPKDADHLARSLEIHKNKYLFKHDNHKALESAIKSTPDYLPSRLPKLKNTFPRTYWSYYKHIIVPTQGTITKPSKFKKKINGKQLSITWNSPENKATRIPVAYYHNTKFKLNGKTIHPKVAHKMIKIPKVNAKIGKNELIVYYKAHWISNFLVIFNLIIWFILLLVTSFKKIQKNRS
ncbi:hypothetical protein GSH19_03485 [Lactobacillus sp. S2-2]|uniref:hypothetical protein n=1 Tax=Lactobacillus sp. S2-2 TaxID=2692917 RepID=UPI001F1D8A3C|nr:hypothetical protein [Lactobacillus sp. S2-2]MCF6515216.1 hypothetical protein [Lactobacillus sp. S2-2]